MTGTRTQVAATRKTRKPEDLAGLVTDLQLLAGPAVGLGGAGDGDDVQRERRREGAEVADGLAHVTGDASELLARDGGKLGLQGVDARLTGTGSGLVARDDQLVERELAVQRPDRDDHRQGRAVGVGDDAARGVERRVGVDLGHHQRHVVVHPERAGVVDGEGAAGGRDRRPFGGNLVGDVEDGEVDPVEDLGGERLDHDVFAAHRQGLAGAAGGGDEADLAPHVLALGDQLAHDGADRAGGADDGKGRACATHRPVPP